MPGIIPTTQSVHPANVMKTSQTNNSGEDYLQVQDEKGNVLSNITANGGINVPTLSINNTTINQIQTNSTTYQITAGDISSNSAVVSSTWGTAFADTNYIIVQSVQYITSSTADFFNAGDISAKSTTGFTSTIYVNTTTSGIVLTLQSIGLHN